MEHDAWGDHLVLVAITRMLNRRIRIYTHNSQTENSEIYREIPTIGLNNDGSPLIVIYYIYGQHYEAFRWR